jgi:hypothetical protein
VAKPKKPRKTKPRKPTSHADFAAPGHDGGDALEKLVVEAEKANAKAGKPLPPKLIRHHIQQITLAQATSDQAKGVAASKRKILANKFKTAAMDGMDVPALKRAFKTAQRPMAEVVAEERNVGLYLQHMDVEIGHQWSMFDSPAVDVRAQGEHAGKNGEPPDCPHKPGTEEFDLWMTGHRDGQASLAREMGGGGPPN